MCKFPSKPGNAIFMLAFKSHLWYMLSHMNSFSSRLAEVSGCTHHKASVQYHRLQLSLIQHPSIHLIVCIYLSIYHLSIYLVQTFLCIEGSQFMKSQVIADTNTNLTPLCKPKNKHILQLSVKPGTVQYVLSAHGRGTLGS